MDTLAFGYILPATGRIQDFHPLETCAARRTIIKLPAENSTDNFMPNHHGEAQTIPKNFKASVIAASFSGGHFGCLEFSDFGLL